MARIEKHAEVGFFLGPYAYTLAHEAYAVVEFKEPGHQETIDGGVLSHAQYSLLTELASDA